VKAAWALILLLAGLVVFQRAAVAQVYNTTCTVSGENLACNGTETTPSPSPTPTPEPTPTPTPQPTPTPTPSPTTCTSAYDAVVLGTPGLADYYCMNETSGSTLHDSVGSHNGTIIGVPGDQYALGLPIGISDGSVGVDFWDSYAYAGGLGNSDPEWSITAIVRPCDAYASPTHLVYLFGTYGADSANAHNGIGIMLAAVNSSSPLTLFVYWGNGTAASSAPLVGEYSITCAPIHFAINYSSLASSLCGATGPCFTVWINGVPVNTTYATIPESSGVSINAFDYQSNYNYFGHGDEVAKVAIFHSYITQAQINAELWAAGL